MYIAAGNPRGQNFDVNRNLLSLRSLATSFQKISLNSDLTQFFHDFIHVHSPGARADNPLGAKFWCQQEHLVTSVICCKFHKKFFEVWFYTFFSWFNTCIKPRGRGRQPPGDKILMSTERALSLYPYVASFKEISLKSDFIQFFSWFNTCI